MTSPAGGAATTTVNVAGKPTFGGADGGVIVTLSDVWFTVTPVETLTEFPWPSVTVALIVYAPAER